MKNLFKKLLIISVLISTNITFADDQGLFKQANNLWNQEKYIESKPIFEKLLEAPDKDIRGRHFTD